MSNDKLLATIDNFGLAVQRALGRTRDGAEQDLDAVIESLTGEVQATIEALDRPGNTPTGEDPFDHYTDLINHLTADIAELRQSDVVSEGRLQTLSDTLSVLSGAVSALRPQQTLSDSAPGTLMVVGAFGLGGNALIITDPDAIYRPTGYYDVSDETPWPNRPITGWTRIHHITHDNATGYATQYATGRFESLSTYYFQRMSASGTWGPWVHMVHSRNMVGPVYQVGDVPGGAIIESGTNANGRYIRYADGTQIATHRIVANALNTYGVGTSGLFGTDAHSWNLPVGNWIEHTLNVYGSTIGPDAAGAVWATAYRPPNALLAFGGSWRGVSAENRGEATTLVLFAIGRWY